MAFDGPYGVYHSQYDDHLWVARIGDPGFRYHETMTKLWGVMALRLANAEALPMDYRPYASRVGEFVEELKRHGRRRRRRLTPRPRSRRSAGRRAVRQGGGRDRAEQSAALANNDAPLLAKVNARLMRGERALLDPEGIPGRPWYRHQIYAPKPTYAPELLPALNEAIDRATRKVAEAVSRISAALDRSAKALRRIVVQVPSAGGARARMTPHGKWPKHRLQRQPGTAPRERLTKAIPRR
jgi:N-acetylated-alpha-linked acidic dipeptidase